MLVPFVFIASDFSVELHHVWLEVEGKRTMCVFEDLSLGGCQKCIILPFSPSNLSLSLDMICAVVTKKCGCFHNGSCVEKQCILLFGCHQHSDYFLWCNSLPSLDYEIFYKKD